ncbi:unnamed protein product [Ixodes pacificus]
MKTGLYEKLPTEVHHSQFQRECDQRTFAESSGGGTQDEERNLWMPGGMRTEEACQRPYEEVAQQLGTDLRRGLSWREANRRLVSLGPNEFEVRQEEPLWKKYSEQFKNPLIVLLLASAVVSICMQQFDDAFSITAAIIIVVTVAFVQEYRSEKSLEELNKLVPPACHCLRDGQAETFLAKNLVPGDVVILNVGDRVPADLRLFSACDLMIDESSFTGETEPSAKVTTPLAKAGNGIASKHNVAFMGTLVRYGNGRGIVINTGEKSEFGDIFKMMQAEEAPKTPLQKSMDSLGKQLSLYSFGIIGLIMLLGWIQGRPVLEMFNIGVRWARLDPSVGECILLPALAAAPILKSAFQNVIPQFSAGHPRVETWNVTGSLAIGALGNNSVASTALAFLSLSRSLQCHMIDIAGAVRSIQDIFTICCALCSRPFQIIAKDLSEMPHDFAMYERVFKLMGIYDVRNHYVRLQEIPFSSEHKMMAVKVIPKFGGEQEQYFVKGALSKILAHCTHYSSHGVAVPMSTERASQYIKEAQFMGRKGLRGKSLRSDVLLSLASGTHLNQLKFLGLVGILDPPRPGVREAIETLHSSGVNVKMLTGDAEETACTVAARLGLHAAGNVVLSGDQLDTMTDMELQRIIGSVSVFYRTAPGHKLRIVKALQKNHYIVGMTGDGVNDGAALKKADIGIAMGKIGTDVCKEAADMILVDDDFFTIMAAIEEGKGIFYNIRNFVMFQLSTSIAALSLIALSTLMKIPNPLNAMQILWINIIMDGPPAQSLGVEPVDHDVLKQPPRNTKQPMITRDLIFNVVLSSLIIILGTLFIFRNEMSDQMVTPRDTTMTFTCFVFFDMFNALSCRRLVFCFQTKSVFTIGFFSNKMFLLAVAFSVIGQMLVIYFPPLQRVFQTEALTFQDIALLVGVSSTVFIVSELKKFLERSISRRVRKKQFFGSDFV